MVKTPSKAGFTIIEVALFLALSGLLMVGLIAGTSASISRQRYNDSVNSFGEFLRTAYNDVSNISNDGTGRSNRAIYGKLLIFGEASEPGTVVSYDVVGFAVNSSHISDSDTRTVLRKVGANIMYNTTEGAGVPVWQFYRRTTYTVPWSASLERSDGGRYYGALLIVRSPVSGIIQTYSINYGNSRSAVPKLAENIDSYVDYLNNYLSQPDGDGLMFSKSDDIDICVDSDDNRGRRRDVRIDRNAVNSSGVLLVELNSDDAAGNRCDSDSSLSGNVPAGED